jgi:signal transduction histidine kinase
MLTAMGSMLTRARRHAPEGSPLRAELHEVSEIAQASLDSMRGLSQTLHPSILESSGLDETIAWYLDEARRHVDLDIEYQRVGSMASVGPATGIHVYRVLQEALSNAARHSESRRVWVRLRHDAEGLELEVEDHGKGLGTAATRRSLGIVTMMERAELVGGTIEFMTPDGGGTLVRLRVPAQEAAAYA